MVRQISRRLRRRSFGEVGGGADDRHAHVRRNTHGDHVFRHLITETNADVILLRNDIGQAVVDDHLDLDVRVVWQ